MVGTTHVNSNLGSKILSSVTINSTKITTENLYKIDLSSLYSNYKKITVDNIVIQLLTCNQTVSGCITRDLISYDSSTGLLTINGKNGGESIILWGSTLTADIAIVI